ncbi:MAG TPA: hypothetical protein VFR31_10880 [Thermoanaerobaculia bacterium]|nr:hypothetical protein [Thermoanaerobaculia bacterium]
MKRFFVALLLLAWSSGSEATYPGAEYFLHSELNLSYWSNHCRRSDTDMLYFRGLTEALNSYILEKGKGTKKLEISVQDPAGHGSAPGVTLSQNRKGYHIFTAARRSSDFNLPLLVQLVEYFASPSWKFYSCCRDYDQADSWRVLHRLLDKEIGEPDMSFFQGRRSVVFETGDFQVIYEEDRLFYSLAGKTLDLEPGDPVPVKVGQRYLFGSKGFFHVYENGVEVQRTAKSEQCASAADEPLLTRVHDEWVNVSCGLRYLYKENRFEQIPSSRADEYKRTRCSDERGGGAVHPPPLRVIHE